MSISDTKDFQELIQTAADDVADRFVAQMTELFNEDPAMFEGPHAHRRRQATERYPLSCRDCRRR